MAKEDKSAKPAYVPPDNSEVLVIQLTPSEAWAVENRHGEFIKRIKETIGLTVVTSADEAIKFINSQHPAFILAVDSEFANPNYRRLQNEVAFIVEHGAAFIMCGEFPRNVDTDNFRQMALNAFNLGWEPGPVHKGIFSLHKPCDVLDGIHRANGVEMDLEIAAALVHNVDDRSRLYICKGLDADEDTKFKNFAALAFEKRGQGYLGWVGDINGRSEIHNVIFKFIDCAGPKFRTGRLLRLRKERNLPQTGGGRPVDHIRRQRAIRVANRAPASQRGPCDHCGKALATHFCLDCNAVFYCSRSCMNVASRKHKEVCAAHRATLSQAIELANQGSPMPLVRELVVFPKDHQEVLERLIDCYRFRVEDLHNVSGIEAGCYRDSGSNGVHMEEFVNFLRQLQRSNQPVRPPWWELASQIQCEDMARNHIMRYYIGNRADEDEVVAHYGEKLMPAALRALGDILYGHPVPQRVDIPQDQENQGQLSALEVAQELEGVDSNQWERASSNDTDEIDRALEDLKLDDPATVAAAETKAEPPTPSTTSVSPALPATQVPADAPNAAPRQPPKPNKREPIVHVWEPPNTA
ncbi:hypothetical protein TWF281_000962 [Arthrobotrys megalospora]